MRFLSLIAVEILILSSASSVWSRNFWARPRSQAEIEEKWGTWSDSTVSQIGSNSSSELLPRSLPEDQCSSTEECADLSCCANTYVLNLIWAVFFLALVTAGTDIFKRTRKRLDRAFLAEVLKAKPRSSVGLTLSIAILASAFLIVVSIFILHLDREIRC